MTDDPPQKYPAYRLGEYTVIDEIAEGTFGKVKSESIPPCILAISPRPPSTDNAQWPCTR